MYCKNCGAKLPDGQMFCNECGPIPSELLPKKHRSTLFITGTVVVAAISAMVVVLLLAFGCFNSSRSTSDVEAVMESMAEANGGITPELLYADDGSLRSIRGTFTKRAIYNKREVLGVVNDIAPLLGIEHANDNFSVAGIEYGDDGDVTWWLEWIADSRARTSSVNEVVPVANDIGITTDKEGEAQELVVEPLHKEIQEVDDDFDLLTAQSVDKQITDYQSGLDVRTYALDYYWQTRKYRDSNTAYFRWAVGAGIENQAAIGSEMRDFDGDGDDELLVVRWQDSSYKIEMVDVVNGAVAVVPLEADLRSQQEIDTPQPMFEKQSPFFGTGCLDVLVDESNAIVVQWWFHTAPNSDGHEWLLDRFSYTGADGGFVHEGRASMVGTGLDDMELNDLISQVRATGTSTSALEGLSYREKWDFNTIMLAEKDSSFRLVTRLRADDDKYSYQQSSPITSNPPDDWCDPQLLGTFSITQG